MPNIAATVCDKEGIVLYQNKRAIDRDGDVVGKNLYNCHGEKAGAMIRHMIEADESNTYQIIRHGKHKLLHQTPWYDEEGNVAGLIELAIDLPDEMPVFNRDKQQNEDSINRLRNLRHYTLVNRTMRSSRQ